MKRFFILLSAAFLSTSTLALGVCQADKPCKVEIVNPPSVTYAPVQLQVKTFYVLFAGAPLGGKKESIDEAINKELEKLGTIKLIDIKQTRQNDLGTSITIYYSK